MNGLNTKTPIVNQIDIHLELFHSQNNVRIEQVNMCNFTFSRMMRELAFVLGKDYIKRIKKYKGVKLNVDKDVIPHKSKNHITYTILKKSKNWDRPEKQTENW